MSIRERPIGRRATIRDVAVRAGVATSTVSRALSDPGRVHPVTRERVLEAARDLGYHLKPVRSPESEQPQKCIALLIPDIANPYYAEITRGTQVQLGAAGFLQVLADTEESAVVEAAALRQVGRLTDGVLLAATRLSDAQLRAAAPGTPLVLINRIVDGFASVCLDTGLGIGQAIDHLVSLGHRRIAYLSGPAGSWSDRIRWSVIQKSAQDGTISAVKLGPFAPTQASGAAAAEATLTSEATAVIAFNDLLAIGVLQRLAERGVSVPGTLSVIGCDDIFGADFCNPPLTTVAGDLQRVGRTAVQLLLALLEDPKSTPQTVALPTHLAIRASTGSPLP
jgi:LacI family transcriptional regulator, repressor for deo operon, udp, cdd, tsx, nupC, and nupG